MSGAVWAFRCGQCGGDTFMIGANPRALTNEGLVAVCTSGCAGGTTLADVFRIYVRQTDPPPDPPRTRA
jgi:hypothetical protein